MDKTSDKAIYRSVRIGSDRGRKGAAMTETALLCFFIYVPVLLLVIIAGDLTLDKEKAHVASSYMAFRVDAIDDTDLRRAFFPLATGSDEDGLSVRTVAVESDEIDETVPYTLPESSSGDYSGGPTEHQDDLQYKLYSLAVGEVHATRQLQAMPDGTVQFIEHLEREVDDAGEYLAENDIVELGNLPEDLGTHPVNESYELQTTASSRDYTQYVATLTDLMNGNCNAGGISAGGEMGELVPRFTSAAGLRTHLDSPFRWNLQETFGSADNYEGQKTEFVMHFGATDEVPEDDSFHGGYTYLQNPEAVPDASALRADFYELSPDMFTWQTSDGRNIAICDMVDPLSSERGPEHQKFLIPGDPRD
ncbi:MAG: hypothetical protein KGZ25_02450 [Planctomycetes bacterium]|nr:hypothetical protein [Planctomycetota bacterium]